jgi:methylated-DNA-[protein]-cysteine S-methyltransferase
MNKVLLRAIERSLQGSITIPTPNDIDCTPFQQSILEKIAKIPFGETRTYGDIARIIGKPKGARAIGQVMNKNPLPLIYP